MIEMQQLGSAGSESMLILEMMRTFIVSGVQLGRHEKGFCLAPLRAPSFERCRHDRQDGRCRHHAEAA